MKGIQPAPRLPSVDPFCQGQDTWAEEARLYGIDPQQALFRARGDGMAWVRASLEGYRSKGTPGAVGLS